MSLKSDLAMVSELGFNPYYSTNHTDMTDMASNDYLGLRKHPHAIAEAKKTMDFYGLSMCGTPIACGYSELFSQTEKRLSEFAGVESSIIFPSCYQANNGIFTLLCGENDLIVFDKSCHSSLLQGIFAVSSKCKRTPFLHNDTAHLEKILSRMRGDYEQCFVVTESVFSTEGAIAPLDEIVQLCKKYNAVPVVDDSHGIGVIGSGGKGVLEHFGLNKSDGFDGIYTASLGKALANSGGMVGGKAEVMEKLRYYCPHLIYSTAITPPTLGGVNGILDVYEREFTELSATLWRYKQKLSQSHADFLPAAAPICALLCREKEKTVLTAKKLYENGITSTPFIEPSVPRNQGVVRLIANAGLTEEQVEKACRILEHLESL